jgi:type I restriction enzyme S subunit
MVFSPTLGREIPKEWEVGTLSNYIKEDKGGDWGKDELTGNYTEKVRCIRGADFPSMNGKGKCDAPTRFILQKNATKKLSSGDLIVEISGGSPIQSTGRICYINKNLLDRFDVDVITSNFCKAVSVKSIQALYFVYLHWLRLYEAGMFFNYEGKTTGIKNFLFDNFISTYNLPIASQDKLAEFNSVVEPFFNKIQENLLESERLSEIRDFLLPMLMNGQVSA